MRQWNIILCSVLHFKQISDDFHQMNFLCKLNVHSPCKFNPNFLSLSLFLLLLLSFFYHPPPPLPSPPLDPHTKNVLDWRKRFNVIEGIGRGLLYLHRDSRLRIIHRDLKVSNILLDKELHPKISNFGMARIFGSNKDQANTNRVVGT